MSADSRSSQTEVGAHAVGSLTVVYTFRLLVAVVDMNVHGRVDTSYNASQVAARELVDSIDHFGFPVGPVQPVLKDVKREGVLHIDWRREDDTTVVSIIVRAGNEMELGIHPVELFRHKVNGQAIGPQDIGCHDGSPVGAVHASTLNLGLFSPVSPKHPPLERIHNHGARFIQVLREESLSILSVKVRYRNEVLGGVCPVNMVVDPVHGQTVRYMQVLVNHHLHWATSGNRCAADDFFDSVRPDDRAGTVDVVDGYGATQFGNNLNILFRLEVYLPDVNAVCKQQEWDALFGLAAVMVLGFHHVTLNAFALEAALSVGARLGTRSRNETLVHIIACPVVSSQLEPRVALAVISNRVIATDVGAPAIVVTALVCIATECGLVLVRSTVVLPVANLALRDAVIPTTIKFSVRVTLLHSVVAVVLVGAVGALHLPVAL